ncbi:MAG: hypothetical protein JNL10_21655 [Verrucomicrobiales bacterium]|nr:hypothetical protein [Verrucomicrobiales bacterium]
MNLFDFRGKLLPRVLPLVTLFSLLTFRGLGAGKPDGATAWYPLNGNAQDSLSDQSGTLVGPAGYGLGISGEGVRIEGGGYVQLGWDQRLDRQEFTVETWIRRRSLDQAGVHPIGDGVIFGGTGKGYSLCMARGGQLFMSHIGVNSVYGDGRVTDTEWHHVVMVRSAATIRFYIDAQPAGTVDYGAQFQFSGPYAIGAIGTPYDGERYPFWGDVDEVVFYPRPLTDGEVLAAYQATDRNTAGSCTPKPDGQRGWWIGDAGGTDIAGEGTGVLTDGATVEEGKVGQAFRFVGGASRVLIPPTPGLELQDLTVEMWLKRSTTGIASDALAGAALFAGDTGAYGFVILHGGNLGFGKVAGPRYDTPPRIVDTDWHHIAVTKSGANLVFYVDGKVTDTATFGETFTFGGRFAIGAGPEPIGGSHYSFLGSLDEVSVYDRPLGPGEIERIWFAGSGGKCRGGLRLSLYAPEEVVVGRPFEFVTTVGNQGTNVLANVVVTNRIPPGFKVGNIQTTAGTAVTESGPDGSSVILKAVDLPAGAQATVQVSLQNSPQGRFTLEATAVSSGDSPPVAASTEILVRPECVPAATGLAAWWRGEGSAWDEIAGVEGSVSNGVSFVEGRVENAFRFDGLAGSGVNLGRVPALQRNEFTIEGWLRRASASAVSQSGDGGNILGADYGGWTFVLLRDGSLTFGRSDISSVVTSPVLLDVAWHHVAVARTLSEVRFYVDGQRVATRPYVETFNLDLDYGIGAIFPSGRNAFLGELDEIAFYNRILEDAEIAAIPQAGGAPKCVNDLQVNAGGSGPIPVGENWEIPIIVTTKGSVDSTQVRLTNAIPAGLQLVSATSTQGTIENLAGLLRADLGTIPARSNAVVTLVVRPLLEGVYDLPVTVGRKEAELTDFNNRTTIRGTAVRLTVSLEGGVTTTEPNEAEFAVVLNAPMVRAVSVNYATEEGTAKAGVDFEAKAGVLEFPPGVVRQTIKIPVLGDGVYEQDESFALVLSQPVNAELGLARALGNIVSPDPIPVVRVRSVTAPEGNAGPTLFGFEFELDRPSGLPSRLRFATTDDSAKAPTDYVAKEGTLEFPPGQTLGTVTVTVNGDTAVEANEMFLLALSDPEGLRFEPAPPAPAIGTIINEDAVAGLATEFRWQGLPATVEAGTAFPAQIQALDGYLNAVAGFNGVLGVQAYAGPGRPSHVILTEIAINTGRGVELQNVSAGDVDVSGWKVYFYDPTLWPAPRYTFTIPQGTTVRPSEVFTIEVNPNLASPGLYPRFRLTGTLRWNDRGVPLGTRPILVGAVVTDPNGAVEDAFFGGAADPRAVGIPTVLSEEDWAGNPVGDQAGGFGFYRPSGQNRNLRRATDWKVSTTSTASMNRANTGLVLPFVDSVPLAVSPDAVSGFTGGLWSGSLTLNGYSSQVRLLADDGNGHRSLSEPFAVRVADDLTVAIAVDAVVATTPSWSSEFVVSVTNLGPVLSSNVTARVLLSPTYGIATSSIVGQPTVTQGTVTVRTRLSPASGPQPEIIANFGDLGPGGIASLVIRAAKSVSPNGRDLPIAMESSVVLTREPAELNLENNAAAVIQELSAPCAPLAGSAAAWWAGESGYTDLLGVLTGVVDGVVGVGEPRAGTASFEFDGVQGAIRVPDAPALDFGAGESFSLEFWMSIPPDAGNSLAVLGKEAVNGPARLGYAATVESGGLRFRIGDGSDWISWGIGNPVGQPGDLRDGQWHHVTIVVQRGEGATFRATIDGVSYFGAGVAPFSGSITNGAPLRFGEAAPGSPEGRFKGRLDEVVVYRQALTFEQSQAAYRAGAHGHCRSEFVIEPVRPKFTANAFGWAQTDPGVVGQPYRFDFLLRNRGPLTSPVSFSVIPNSADTNLYLLTVDGSVPFNPELFAAKADLSQPQSPGEELPFGVYITSTNPTVSLSLFGGGLGLQQKTGTAAVVITMRADTDGDGIPDEVETAMGLNPLSSADAASDTDGDGYSAAAEFEAGTASNDANSALRLRIVEGQVVVDALASRVYRLEYRSDLGAGVWTTLREVRPEADGVLNVGPLGSGADPLYYRVTVQQPYAGQPN